MLQRLEITNYAIIESLEVQWHKGLNIITGETGAGKSILLGALGLIMGKRADSKVLYHSDRKCIVEGVFNIAHLDLQHLFDQYDLDYDDELIIRREIATSGKSRAFVNDTPCNLSILSHLANQLIDLHQQFGTLDIFDHNWQLQIIDCLADNHDLIKEYKEGFKSYTQVKKQLTELKENAAKAAREFEFISFQYEELDKAQLVEGEQELHEQKLSKLNNAEDIKRITQKAAYAIDESEMSIVDQLQELTRELDSIQSFDPAIADNYQALVASIEELRAASQALQSAGDSTEYDPSLAQELNDRLDLIYKLQQKHNVTDLSNLIEVYEQLGNTMHSYQNMNKDIEDQETKLNALESELHKLAKKLRTNRKKAAKPFAKEAENLLATLSMQHAKINVSFQDLDELNTNGLDRIDFLFTANKGGQQGKIKDVASGGEASRLTLVMKSLVADKMKMPTIIFDEIDSGVSGEVARKMADIISKLSQKHQVISITHSPQIASMAHQHYFVHKQETKERTVTGIKVLQQEERIIELAKMLSGNPPSEAALANARELIGS